MGWKTLSLENVDNSDLNDVTKKVIGCGFAVMNSLGSGFLEKVYENALAIELKHAGLTVIQQKRIEIKHRNEIVGDYVADLLIKDKVLVELKSVKEFEDIHIAQCLNYLKATGFRICLLMNFGKPELQFRRISARKEWAGI